MTPPLGEGSSAMPLVSPQTDVTTSDEPSNNTNSSSVPPAAVGETVLQTEHHEPSSDVGITAMETVDIPPAVTLSEAQLTDVALSPKASPSLSAEWPSLAPSTTTSRTVPYVRDVFLLRQCGV